MMLINKKEDMDIISRFKEELRTEYFFFIHRAWTKAADEYLKAVTASDKVLQRKIALEEEKEKKHSLFHRKSKELKEAEKEAEAALKEAVKAYHGYNRAADMMAEAFVLRDITAPYIRSDDAELIDSPLTYQDMGDASRFQDVSMPAVQRRAGKWLVSQLYILCSEYRRGYKAAKTPARRSLLQAQQADEVLERLDMVFRFVRSLNSELGLSASVLTESYLADKSPLQIRLDYLKTGYNGTNDAPDISEFLMSAETILDKIQEAFSVGDEGKALKVGFGFLHEHYIGTEGGSYSLKAVKDKKAAERLAGMPARKYDARHPEEETEEDRSWTDYNDGIYCQLFNNAAIDALCKALELTEMDFTDIDNMHGGTKLDALTLPILPSKDEAIKGAPINWMTPSLQEALQQALSESEEKAEKVVDAEVLEKRRKIAGNEVDFEFRERINPKIEELERHAPYIGRQPILK